MEPSPRPAMEPVGPISRADVALLCRQVKGGQFVNRQLSSICQVNGLKSTGVKAELHQRLVNLIEQTYREGDVGRFHQIRQSLANAQSVGSKARPSQIKPADVLNLSTSRLPAMPTTTHASSSNRANGFPHSGSAAYHQSSMGQTPTSITFKPSPFYRIEAAIGTPYACPVMSQHRNSVTVFVRVTDHISLQRCVEDSSYRIMVFCAGEGVGTQDIVFPHQSELKINGGEFKANLRGLKNKPGSTRPVDVTSAMRLKGQYENKIEFTYALTQKKYFLAVYVCKIEDVNKLAASILTRRRIPKESVIAELNKKAQDPDVVATSQVLSLKCPLTYMRLNLPCRSTSCTHIQCFDATSYLQLQEQGPQWLCPICNKAAPFEQLAVDEYVRDILQKTSKSLESVTIEPNGQWADKATNDQQRYGSTAASFDDDDDLEISEVSVVNGRQFDTPKSSKMGTATPSSVDRLGSVGVGTGTGTGTGTPRRNGAISGKRPAAEVIDLTLSSDEDDDEPIQRPAKRQNLGSNGIANGNANGSVYGYRDYRDYREPTNSLGFLSESPDSFPIE